LLKINRVFNWKPTPFDLDNMNATETSKKAAEAVPKDRLSVDNVAVSCEGENDGDADNLGKVEFFPPLGFPFKYYPYENAKHYRAPLVFARFSNLQPGVIIQVWCKLWEARIKHHKNDKAGSVHFELLVDTPRHHPEVTTVAA